VNLKIKKRDPDSPHSLRRRIEQARERKMIAVEHGQPLSDFDLKAIAERLKRKR